MSTSHEGTRSKWRAGGGKCVEVYLEKEWLTALQKSYNTPSNPQVGFVTVFNTETSFGGIWMMMYTWRSNMKGLKNGTVDIFSLNEQKRTFEINESI
jgi:hypothetical protein